MIGVGLGELPGDRFDLIVVGGGIHGASVLLEAVRAGLRCLLLERDDVGQGASGNSLRILHGGLRYLQTADLARFRQSVTARRWYATKYPHLVKLLPCAMPTYGKGARRRAVMRVALALNDVLSADRNRGVPATLRMPGAGTCSATELRSLWPAVPTDGLEGGALWFDYMMRSSERILIETLLSAVELGACVRSHANVDALLTDGDRVTGVRATTVDGSRDIGADLVVNCAGAWARDFATRADRDHEVLFRPSLAFNLLLSRRIDSRHALAVAPMGRGNPVYFVIPQGDTVLAGTVHRPRPAGTTAAVPTETEIEAFLADLNDAVPGLAADRASVCRVFAGLLPVKRQDDVALTKREVIHDHGTTAGPRGLFTVTGIKYTTAQVVAAAAMRTISRARGARGRPGPDAGRKPATTLPPPSTNLLLDGAAFMRSPDDEVAGLVTRLVRVEGARTADDIIYRRSNWSTTVADLAPLHRRVAQFIGRIEK